MINKAMITRAAGRGSILLKKYSPEILLGSGIVGIIASTVLACKATLKAEELLEETKATFHAIENAKTVSPPDRYTLQDYRKDLALAGVQTTVAWGKLYGPALALGVASLSAIIGSHGIMQRRTASLMAAYGLIQESFASYRRRVLDTLGEEEDRKFRFGVREIEVIEEGEIGKSGKPKKGKKSVKKEFDPNAKSDYARFFDEYSNQWRNEASMNMFFLKAQQVQANDLLTSHGHLFLNEVYDMLGIPRSKEGAVVGWVINGDGDNFVDFGIYEPDAAAFVNGYETSVLLDFNVDGVIYDKI